MWPGTTVLFACVSSAAQAYPAASSLSRSALASAVGARAHALPLSSLPRSRSDVAATAKSLGLRCQTQCRKLYGDGTVAQRADSSSRALLGAGLSLGLSRSPVRRARTMPRHGSGTQALAAPLLCAPWTVSAPQQHTPLSLSLSLLLCSSCPWQARPCGTSSRWPSSPSCYSGSRRCSAPCRCPCPPHRSCCHGVA